MHSAGHQKEFLDQNCGLLTRLIKSRHWRNRSEGQQSPAYRELDRRRILRLQRESGSVKLRRGMASLDDWLVWPQLVSGHNSVSRPKSCYDMAYMEPNHTGAHPAPQVQTQDTEGATWFTVSEAVIRCTDRGLSRTPKTIRKWASRSFASPESADISVRREDTENGFRWSIEATSLDLKIDEELEFERRKEQEPDRTGPHPTEPVSVGSTVSFQAEPYDHPSEPVQTRDDAGHRRTHRGGAARSAQG